MVQKDGTWQWLLEEFKFDLEAQVCPKTVEYYYDHARIFVRWIETTGIAEPRLLTRRDINSFFHYITNDSRAVKRNNGAGEGARHAESLRFHYYRGIKRFCLWLKLEGYLENSPLDGIVVKPPKEPPIEPYTLEHEDKLIAVLDHDWKVAKTPRQRMLAARCLLTPGEINLGWNDISNVLLQDGGTVISFGSGTGESRATKACEDALSNYRTAAGMTRRAARLLFRLTGPEDLTVRKFPFSHQTPAWTLRLPSESV